MCALVPSLNQIVAGNSDDPTRDMSNWNNIVTIVNGQLGKVNWENGVIAASDTALGTYTAWTTWVPTYVSDGTYTSVTATLARYTQIGKSVTIQVYITGTVGGMATYIGFTLPIAPLQSTTGYVSTGARVITNIGSIVSGTAEYNSTTSAILVRQRDEAAYGTGAGVKMGVNLTYEVA